MTQSLYFFIQRKTVGIFTKHVHERLRSTYRLTIFNFITSFKDLFKVYCSVIYVTVFFQDNYNVLHVSAMYSREDVVKLLLAKKGVDPYATGGVSNFIHLSP